MTAPDARSAGFDASALHATIVSFARPRMTASAGAREVDALIRRRFQELGYDVRTLPFSFSTLPGRYGLPLAGAILLATAAGAGGLLSAGRSGAAVGALAGGLTLAVLPLLLLDPAIRRLPWGRVETANLLFTRATPRWLVMAHRDTKSQRAPTLIRTVALAAALMGWVALAAIALAGLPGDGPVPGAGWVWGSATVLAGGAVVLLLSRAANRSPGALDNGSGLAALLAVAGRAPADVAFLVTDGEELGLAGARAAVGGCRTWRGS
ncbi:MAG: M28 family peptidase [Candidatus Longimicrobiales bacterium M2_2A_002]